VSDASARPPSGPVPASLPGPLPAPSAPRLSIGALSRATGIPVETLRTWESRYGFPEPERKPSGHRVYKAASVPRLRRIAAALSRGHRASECVPASDDDLDALLGVTPGGPAAAMPTTPALAVADLSAMLEAVSVFDAERLTRLLLDDWARLGPMGFLTERAGPLVQRVGHEWRAGRLQVSHEHFVSERLTDVLRTLRLPFDARADGPLLVFATLPGERHGLGLQMAALVASVAGWRVLYLGTEMPPEQVAATVAGTGARAVALSMSAVSAGPESTAMLTWLREALPARVALVVGGEGAPGAIPGVDVPGSFEGFGQRLDILTSVR